MSLAELGFTTPPPVPRRTSNPPPRPQKKTFSICSSCENYFSTARLEQNNGLCQMCFSQALNCRNDVINILQTLSISQPQQIQQNQPYQQQPYQQPIDHIQAYINTVD